MDWTINVSVNIHNATKTNQTVTITLHPKFNVVGSKATRGIEFKPLIYISPTLVYGSSRVTQHVSAIVIPNILKGYIYDVDMEYNTISASSSLMASTYFTLTENITGGRLSLSNDILVPCDQRSKQLYKISPNYDLKTAGHDAHLELNIELL